jgi:membrane protein involved in colicin uptake
MKIIAIVIVFACFSGSARAVDEATPSPTPIFLKRHVRPGAQRRQRQVERRPDLQDRNESRAQAKASRHSTAAAKAQAKAAGRTREQARREVEAQARREAANAAPRPTSDLMSRMGFSGQEIATQKAREQPAKPEAKEPAKPKSQHETAVEKPAASVPPAPSADSH